MSYSVQTNGYLECQLCPHNCKLLPDSTGICRVRKNNNGELGLPYYGIASGLAVDPIEKKPLYHFYPGSQILSIGFFGCNLRCPFCQNYDISQRVAKERDPITPEELVEMARQRRSIGIAYTYSEPLVHFEYVVECATAAHNAGLVNVLVSNGFLNETPAKELLGLMDAANIDLKSFNQGFYRKELKGDLDPVLRFIELAAKSVHLEVTTLVIPGRNDGEEEISNIAGFLAGLNPSIPLHLSCYYPTYKYSVAATPPETVFQLADVAHAKLHYVYPGNVGGRETNTTCPTCSNLLIKRHGYITEVVGIADGKCKACCAEIPIPGV